MRVIENRSASGAELLPAGKALIDAAAFVLTVRLAGNRRDAANLATVDTANFAFGPAHLFDVIEALGFGVEFSGYVYELHNEIILAEKGVCVKCIIAI